jgi:hypothetical protein
VSTCRVPCVSCVSCVVRECRAGGTGLVEGHGAVDLGRGLAVGLFSVVLQNASERHVLHLVHPAAAPIRCVRHTRRRRLSDQSRCVWRGDTHTTHTHHTHHTHHTRTVIRRR